jgi:hypothetical protein
MQSGPSTVGRHSQKNLILMRGLRPPLHILQRDDGIYRRVIPLVNGSKGFPAFKHYMQVIIMKNINCRARMTPCLFSVAAFFAMTQSAFGVQPPDVVVSDSAGNTAMGSGVLNVNIGSHNTAAGDEALNINTTGSNNAAFGYDVLFVNSGGSGNSGFGSQALAALSSGNDNTAAGMNALYSNNGSFNTAVGMNSLYKNHTGTYNTATGYEALYNNVGNYNAAFGDLALFSNNSTNANNNTAVGHATLYTNQTGGGNTGVGTAAMYSNVSGSYDTATGFQSLNDNTSGAENTAAGWQALYSNVIASYNTAFGTQALYANDATKNGEGVYNTATGWEALYNNVTGADNTASGALALSQNQVGNGNTAFGTGALIGTTGANNVGVGYLAGENLGSGSNNIDIGTGGSSSDNGIIRIGTQSVQTATVIAGIYGSNITGSVVYVNSSGQLGVQGSSERFKTDIATMPELSDKLQQLHPVTFHYKTEPKGVLQYGLIAEEVDKVYPELVIRDEKGIVQGVRYEELAPMLLKELQRQQVALSAQADEIRGLKIQVAAFNDLKEEMAVALQQLKATAALVAQR